MDSLPAEMVFKILSYLNSYDLMQFCTACENDNVLHNYQQLIREVDFSGFKALNIELCKYITTYSNYNQIKVLNINYVYWIPNEDLRTLVNKLENLEVLYAIDTKLGLNNKDAAEYVKLKKLAVSVGRREFGDSTMIIASKNVKVLRSLCLKILQTFYDQSNGILLFFRELEQLEEVWIFDESRGRRHHINYDQIATVLTNLKKFVIKSRPILPCYDFSCMGLVKVFECKRNDSSATELVFEKALTKSTGVKPIIEQAENDYERSWQIFQKYDCKYVPYGPKKSHEIYFTKSIKQVCFEDLNFSHKDILCNSEYIDSALNILSSKNSSRLKRLSFRSCLFKNQIEETVSISGFKRSRKMFYSFHNIANNLKNLRELEILACPECLTEAIVSVYPIIGTFKYLKKLVLEIPLLLDGSFLKDVFIKCQHLESLYLLCKFQNDKFIMNLCQSLKYSQNLQHFRLEDKEVPIANLLSGFNKIEPKKLLRIFIKCDSIQSYDNQEESLVAFMENNPQLVFSLFIIRGNPKPLLGELRNALIKFKANNPAKVYAVNKYDRSHGVCLIPTAHHDLIFYHTTVAVVDVIEF